MTNQTKIKKLLALEDKVIASYIEDSVMRGAEEFAPVYKRNPKLFKQLLRSELKTLSSMRKYFKELSERVVEQLNWSEFERNKASATAGATYKAAILDYLVQSFWENETLVLKILLTKSLVDALEAGGLYTEEELKIEVGWSRESVPAIEFLNKYTLNLSGQLTKTTQSRILKTLQSSIDNGENREGAVERINRVLKDPVRSTAIAQTESVRAFSSGRMEVGRQVGADRKRWRTAGDNKVSTTCRANASVGIVPFDYKFKDLGGGSITEPPAHVNCRSGIELFMPGEKV